MEDMTKLVLEALWQCVMVRFWVMGTGAAKHRESPGSCTDGGFEVRRTEGISVIYMEIVSTFWLNFRIHSCRLFHL
jgi:hypothetical protein